MKILIVGPAWIGDMVMAQSLFSVLQNQHAGLILDVLAPDWTRPLLERMPEVNKALKMPLGHGKLGFGERRRLGHDLRSSAYDQAIVLPNSLKSALVPWFANIPLRTGWRGEMRFGLLNDCRKLDKDALPLMVQRFVALAHPSGSVGPPVCPPPLLKVRQETLPALLAKKSLNLEKPVLVLCPGAEYGPSKQWPAEYFSVLARQALGAGKQVWIAGSAKDQSAAQEIAVQAGQSTDLYNLCGQTTLAEVIDLISMAKAVVTNDSGLMHLAAALARPLVSIYGSTSPDFTPPLGEEVKILTSALQCSPCFERECPLKHHECMKLTTVDMVSQALMQLEQEGEQA